MDDDDLWSSIAACARQRLSETLGDGPARTALAKIFGELTRFDAPAPADAPWLGELLGAYAAAYPAGTTARPRSDRPNPRILRRSAKLPRGLRRQPRSSRSTSMPLPTSTSPLGRVMSRSRRVRCCGPPTRWPRRRQPSQQASLARNIEKTSSVAVVGLGHVGLPLAICFADCGVRTIGVDVDAARVETVIEGRMPFDESRLQEVMDRVHAAGLLTASTDVLDAAAADFIVLTLGTPSFSHIESTSAQVRDGDR